MKKYCLFYITIIILSLNGYTQTVVNPNCNETDLSFNYDLNLNTVNRVSFTIVTDSFAIDQLWNISKPSYAFWNFATVHSNNPVYDFADSGYYKVCLNVLFKNRCRKEVCNFVNIASPIPDVNPCNMQVIQTSSTVNISVNPGNSTLIHAGVFNYLNMAVLNKDQQANNADNVISFDISNLVAGNYFIKLEYNSQVCTKRFTKE